MFTRKQSYWLSETHTESSAEIIVRPSNPNVQSKDRRPQNQTCYFNFRPFLGFIYTFLSSLSILISSVFVKQLDYISSGQLSFARNLGLLLGCLPIAVFSTTNILGPRSYWWLLCVRSFAGATALYLNLLAYRILPMAEAAIILSTVPVLVSVIARFYLKEKFGWVQGFAIVFTLTGMCLSIRLSELLQQKEAKTDETYFTGLCCAFGCVLLISFNMVCLRKMKDIHFSVVNLYFGVLGSLENGILTGTLSSYSFPFCGWDGLKVMLMGVFGFFGQCLLTLALQIEAAGVITVLKASCDIAIAMFFQTLFFDNLLDLYNVGGALIVIMSVSMLGTRKWLQTLPENSIKRKKLRYLLL